MPEQEEQYKELLELGIISEEEYRNLRSAQVLAPPKQSPVVTPRASNSTQSTKNKTTAGLLGIFLGGLGVHKFYLGYTTAGIIMLVVTLVVCFFVFLPIMAVIGLVEGIIYLTKTDEEFQEIYAINKREWF